MCVFEVFVSERNRILNDFPELERLVSFFPDVFVVVFLKTGI